MSDGGRWASAFEGGFDDGMQRRRQKTRDGRGFFARLAYAFRERQIYLRSEGEVQFITLTPATQLVTLACVLAGLFWTAYATINVAFKDQLLILKEQRMYQARLDYEDQVAGLRRAIDGLNLKLLLDQNAYLAKVDEARGEQTALTRQHDRIVAFFRQGWFPLKDAAPPAAEEAAPLKSGFNEDAFVNKYAADFRTPEEVLAPIADLRGLYRGFAAEQVLLLDGAEAYANARTNEGAQIFTKLGLEVPRGASGDDAAGGPFIAASLGGAASGDPVEEAMTGVSRSVAALENLKQEAAALPLYWPMKQATRISSEFGLRADPFRRTQAMHAGVDFKAPWAEPVLATADGVILNAGWSGGYGKLVEIRHDNGVTTRYGHLSSIDVSPGQRVKRGDIVGRMGNTGRSTGAHLHYETRVNGEAIDPVRFWRTRDDLQKLKTQEIRQ